MRPGNVLHRVCVLLPLGLSIALSGCSPDIDSVLESSACQRWAEANVDKASLYSSSDLELDRAISADRAQCLKELKAFSDADLERALEKRLPGEKGWQNSAQLEEFCILFRVRWEQVKYDVEPLLNLQRQLISSSNHTVRARHCLFRAVHQRPRLVVRYIEEQGLRPEDALGSELLAALSLTTNINARNLVKKALDNYSSAPELCDRTLEVMPLDSLEKYADFSLGNIRAIARKRLAELPLAEMTGRDKEAGQEQLTLNSPQARHISPARMQAAVLGLGRKQSMPMHSIILVDLFADRVLGKNVSGEQELTQAQKKRLQALFRTLTVLKSHIDEHREAEKMFYASVYARIYRQFHD